MTGNSSSNKVFGWLKREWSKNRVGKTKENDDRVRRQSDTMRGRTKEEYEYLRRHSEKMKGRSKETHEYIKNIGDKNRQRMLGENKTNSVRVVEVSDKLRGRTKEDFEYLRVMGEKNSLILNGRTKESHEYIRLQADKIRGRTKEEYEYLRENAKKISEKKRKISNAFILRLVELKELNFKHKEIVEILLEEFDHKLSYSSVSTIYNRYKTGKMRLI